MMMVGVGNAWAEDVTIASGTFDGKNATYTEGWSTTGTGKGRNDCVIIGSGENITSPAIDLSGYSKVTISINARRYGSLSGSKATIDASISGTSVGTTDATGTNAKTTLTAIEFEPTSTMTSVAIVFTCTNATSSGSTHGAGVNSITIIGTPKEGPVVHTLGAPVFSPAEGSYYYGQKITATAANAEGIVYTTTGIDPTDESSEWPSDGYTLTGNVTLKAMSYDSDLNFSDVTTATYTLKAPEAPTFSIEGGAVKSGRTLTLTPGEGGAFVVYTTDGTDPTASSDLFDVDNPIVITEACTIKAATIDGGNNLSTIVSYDFTISTTQSVVYEKLTSAADLAVGDQLIIGCVEDNHGKYVMGTLDGSVHKGIAFELNSEGNVEDPTDDVVILTLGGTKDAWTLQSNITNNYLTINSDGNRLDESTTADANAQKWTIDENTLTIFNNNLTSREIQFNYNSGNPRFAAYKSSQKAISLFRLQESLADNLITLSPSEAQTLNYGESVVVTAAATNGGAVTAVSSDETLATVTDNGNGTFTVSFVNGTNEGVDAIITFSTPKTSTHKYAEQTLTVTLKDSRLECPISYAEATVTVNVEDAASFTAQTLTGAEGLTITYEMTGDAIGTIDENTGAVTLNGTEGIATVTATFAGNNSYQAGTASYTLTVTDPNKKGTATNPYTVAEAIAFINTLGSNTSEEDVYVSGIISQVDSYNSSYKSITYWISDDGTTTGQMEVYSGKGLNGADFSSKNDLAVGDIVTVKGKVKMYGETPEFDKNNQLVSFVHVEKPSINADNVELTYDATSGEIAYTITNPVDGQNLTAATTADWISNITVTADKITFTTTANEGSTDRSATITLSYEGANDKEVTITQLHQVTDYATLPFVWEGGTSSELEAVDGVTTEGVGSDYAATHDPYRVKFDSDGDYIQVKTDGQILNVFVAVKMIGGASESTITVKGSADGENFADVQELTISGKQNAILNLETSNAFTATDRYVRLVFTRGSNVGIGAIAINAVKKSISDAGYATYCSGSALDFTESGLTAYIATMDGNTVKFTPVTTTVPANTGLLLKGTEGEHFINVVAEGATDVTANKLEGVLIATEVGEGAFVLMKGDWDGGKGVGFYKTSSAGFTVGANTAYLPADVAPARTFIGFDDVTAVKGITAETMQNGEVYNLQGQRVMKAQKGLYIMNGKKVIK